MPTWHPIGSTSSRATGYDPEKCETWVEYLSRPVLTFIFWRSPDAYAGRRQHSTAPHRPAVATLISLHHFRTARLVFLDECMIFGHRRVEQLDQVFDRV